MYMDYTIEDLRSRASADGYVENTLAELPGLEGDDDHLYGFLVEDGEIVAREHWALARGHDDVPEAVVPQLHQTLVLIHEHYGIGYRNHARGVWLVVVKPEPTGKEQAMLDRGLSPDLVSKISAAYKAGDQYDAAGAMPVDMMEDHYDFVADLHNPSVKGPLD